MTYQGGIHLRQPASRASTASVTSRMAFTHAAAQANFCRMSGASRGPRRRTTSDCTAWFSTNSCTSSVIPGRRRSNALMSAAKTTKLTLVGGNGCIARPVIHFMREVCTQDWGLASRFVAFPTLALTHIGPQAVNIAAFELLAGFVSPQSSAALPSAGQYRAARFVPPEAGCRSNQIMHCENHATPNGARV